MEWRLLLLLDSCFLDKQPTMSSLGGRFTPAIAVRQGLDMHNWREIKKESSGLGALRDPKALVQPRITCQLLSHRCSKHESEKVLAFQVFFSCCFLFVFLIKISDCQLGAFSKIDLTGLNRFGPA